MAQAETSTNNDKTTNDETNNEDVFADRGVADAVADAIAADTEGGAEESAAEEKKAGHFVTKPESGSIDKGAAAITPARKSKTVGAAKVSLDSAAKPKNTEPKARRTKPAASKPAYDRKEDIMATANKTDTMHTATQTAAHTAGMTGEFQDRMQGAYAKATEFASEAGEFSTANMEAMVESGKLFFDGAQDLVREQVETSKTVVETMTQDAKAIASAKSPTEFMQLQSEMARRNFDAMVSYGSQHTEAWVKLYNEAFTPISNRVSVASEKMAKVAA